MVSEQEMDIEQIVNSIKYHREQEIAENVRRPAIGRSDGILNNEKQTFWIVLSQHSEDDILPDTNTELSVTRDAYLGGILIQNYEGEHKYWDNIVEIFNRAKYTPSSIGEKDALARDITINLSGDTKMYHYRNLMEFISKLISLQEEIKKTQDELENVEAEQNKANEELASGEGEHDQEPQKRTVIIKLKSKAAQLRKKLEEKERRQQAYLNEAQKFIRQQYELRWQPILDSEQDTIKRMKIFDEGTLIINGGPGTGKTTSMIQRIKFLSSKTIEEYKSLNNKQKKILFNQRPSWIFFSPSKLLASFLRNTMAKEELAASDVTVKVWDKHKEDIIRSYGWFEKDKRVFIHPKPRNGQLENNLFSDPGSTKGIIDKFTNYYIEHQRKKLQDNIGLDNVNNVNIMFQKYFEYKLKKYRESKEKNVVSDETKDKDEEKEFDRESQSAFNKSISFFLDGIPKLYKTFRKERFNEKNKNWNLKLLEDLIQDENWSIHPDEQALLICVINMICYNLYPKFSSYFLENRHPYVLTYSANRKPIIAIDEATDFSTIDLLAMHSLRYPEFSSITLSGDLMQRMTTNGLKSWEDFSDMIDSAQIENLTVSYRQSPTLLSLAQSIYQYSTNKKAEYTSYMDPDPLEPKPLMKISENRDDKLKWIADRIREIDIIYRQSVNSLPSVAVFVPEEDDISNFVKDLDNILEGDFHIQACPDGLVLGDSSDIRVYAIDKIKGLEFEAVFFHNLDQLESLQDDLFLKYLYVGLSRATFYLGVTLSNRLNKNLRFIENSFEQTGDWKLKYNEKIPG
ncbi:hypothetical protein AGMMS49928_24350 [Spirochaetia bacterium]|nr:hypothetical protein AGMMS49928_24350 [Spirochaetia bacterium]